ncbi:hypothetical protein M0812_12549 [Anaeramoeba flamelloides]|uniref:Uncharacterized protein n=1 Tax=Anaeramoeba flamelloides TaxID=1746091 RepID=A0AAV7ZQN4_9EUKA|nr:hypothetical protein M0812_12549 [Anaeramoeba flamelloides]
MICADCVVESHHGHPCQLSTKLQVPYFDYLSIELSKINEEGKEKNKKKKSFQKYLAELQNSQDLVTTAINTNFEKRILNLKQSIQTESQKIISELHENQDVNGFLKELILLNKGSEWKENLRVCKQENEQTMYCCDHQQLIYYQCYTEGHTACKIKSTKDHIEDLNQSWENKLKIQTKELKKQTLLAIGKIEDQTQQTLKMYL